MELPKHIKDKIRRQNDHVFRANILQIEIEEWCKKVGIDIDSDEFLNVYSHSDGVGPLSGKIIEKLYNSIK